MSVKHSSPWTRRDFLHASTGVALSAAIPFGYGDAAQSPRQTDVGATPLRDPAVRSLAMDTLDAARSAGAHYADVRLTYTRTRRYNGDAPEDDVVLGLSARALVDGYWGWAARPDLTAAAGPWAGREAVLLAKANAASGRPRRVDWSIPHPVQMGDWSTQVTIDPFGVAVQEILDWQYGLAAYIDDLGAQRGRQKTNSGVGLSGYAVGLSFGKQDRLFASTEGSYLTQTVSVMHPYIHFGYRGMSGDAEPTVTVQAGYEYLLNQHYQEHVRREMDRIDAYLAQYGHIPVRPIDIGRYDMVFSAGAMATLLQGTLGPATELDRALGYEANAQGTSYLGPDPLSLLGTSIASPLVTLTANRSDPLALATIQWDDEGVVPEDFAIVDGGVLVDYQTTREQAAWLAPWYQRQGKPVRSHGCAMAPTALDATMQHTSNLVLHPGTREDDLEELVSGLEAGFLVESVDVDMDFQYLNGLALMGTVTEVRKGKRVARLGGTAALVLRTPDLWKNVVALGGARSQRRFGTGYSAKGEPRQETAYSIMAVPARVERLAVIDPTRKA